MAKHDTRAEILTRLEELTEELQNWRYIDDDYVDNLKQLIWYINDITKTK
nr:MAG: hypothetical protein [Microviridae sp.]